MWKSRHNFYKPDEGHEITVAGRIAIEKSMRSIIVERCGSIPQQLAAATPLLRALKWEKYDFFKKESATIRVLDKIDTKIQSLCADS